MAKKHGAGLGRCDLFYAMPLNINFAGREAYGTCCGACVTWLVILAVLAFLALQSNELMTRYFAYSASTGLEY